MPGGAGRPKRACPMCKHYKYAGNGAERVGGKQAGLRDAHRLEVEAYMAEAVDRYAAALDELADL